MRLAKRAHLCLLLLDLPTVRTIELFAPAGGNCVDGSTAALNALLRAAALHAVGLFAPRYVYT